MGGVSAIRLRPLLKSFQQKRCFLRKGWNTTQDVLRLLFVIRVTGLIPGLPKLLPCRHRGQDEAQLVGTPNQSLERKVGDGLSTWFNLEQQTPKHLVTEFKCVFKRLDQPGSKQDAIRLTRLFNHGTLKLIHRLAEWREVDQAITSAESCDSSAPAQPWNKFSIGSSITATPPTLKI